MSRSRAPTERWTPRRIARPVSSPNQRSTWSIQLAEVGVRWTWWRGRLASRSRIGLVSWVPALPSTRWMSSSGATRASISSRNLRDSLARCRGKQRPITAPAFTSRAANRPVAPWRTRSSWARRSAWPGRSGSGGRVRSSARTRLFSSTHSTRARSGGARWRPTMSRTFSAESGSVESLKLSARCGRRPEARQARPTVAADGPEASATVRRLHCVPPSGRSASVRSGSAATRSSSVRRGAPGRGSSSSPSARSRAKRSRHLPAVCSATPRSAATAVLLSPAAARRTTRARRAGARAALRRRAQRWSSVRSASLRSSAAGTR